MALTADELLQLANDVEVREEKLPGDKGTVYLRAISSAEREAWEDSNRRYKQKPNGDVDMFPYLLNMEARLLVRALSDEDGKRIFKDSDADKVGKLPSRTIAHLFQVARQMNGIGPDAVAEAKGNSDAALSGDSGSDSPSSWDALSPNSDSD